MSANIFDLNCSSNHYGEERGMMYLNDSLNLDSNSGIKVEEKAIANNMENLSNWHSYVYMGIDKKEDVSVIIILIHYLLQSLLNMMIILLNII